MTAALALAQAIQTLEGVVESPRLDAEHLLAGALQVPRAQLFARLQSPMPEAAHARFLEFVGRRHAGEPLAYVLGSWEFWSLPLNVTAEVLVPRPETELLVEWSLELLRGHAAPRIADLGTGSGAIALALARELPQAHIVGIDVSTAALEVARGNAKVLQLPQIEWRRAAFEPALGALSDYDLLVSNPPYIAQGDAHLEALSREPTLALVSGVDGLDSLRAIIQRAPAALRKGGWLLVEHGHDQAAAVRKLFEAADLAGSVTRRDLSGNDRATAGFRL